MSRVHLVRITVGYTVPLTISNLRLPLRSCFENDETVNNLQILAPPCTQNPTLFTIEVFWPRP
uniref:Uncharacterized protein n=1 Tax=Magallana gigas TaxID=29159 RepID=K1QH26_MAGGI